MQVPDEVASLVLKELLEVEALNKAVAQAALLGRQQAARLEGEEAALGALRKRVGCLVVRKLLTLVLREDRDVDLSLGHFEGVFYIIKLTQLIVLSSTVKRDGTRRCCCLSRAARCAGSRAHQGVLAARVCQSC